MQWEALQITSCNLWRVCHKKIVVTVYSYSSVPNWKMMFVTVSLYFPQFWPRKHLVHPKWWFSNNNNSCMFFQFFREQKVYIFYTWGVAGNNLILGGL